DLFRAAYEVCRRPLLGREPSTALHHDIGAERAPGKSCGIALREQLDVIAIDDHHIPRELDRPWEPSMYGIKARQMRESLGTAEVVDRDDFEIAPRRFVERPQYAAADSPVAVNRDPDGHVGSRLAATARLLRCSAQSESAMSEPPGTMRIR